MNKQDKYIYSAIFEPAQEGGYCITFPDLPGCITEGDTLSESLAMAKDALELHLYNFEEDEEEIPEPTAPEKIKVSNGNFIVPIEAYMPLIREEMANKSVKTTVTMPQWLKRLGEEKKVNFSLILQTALKEHLGIKDNK